MNRRRGLAYLAVIDRGKDETEELKRQEGVARRYAKDHSITITGVFSDDHAAAIQQPGERLGMRRMVQEIFTKDVNCIIVESVERFSLQIEEQVALSVYFEMIEVDVVLCRYLDTRQAVAQQDLARASARAFAACKQGLLGSELSGRRKRKKVRSGPKSYGFYPGEKGVIVRMSELREEGLAYGAIAKKLMAEGIRSRQNKSWHGVTVQKILRSQEPRGGC